MNPIQGFLHQARSNGAPVTAAIVAGMAIGFLASFISGGRLLLPLLAFDPGGAPWTLLTYPFAYPPGAIFSVLFGALWLWGIGGSVERELGSQRYAAFFFAMTVLGAVGLWLGSVLTGVSQPLVTAWMPTAAVTVAWGTRNPSLPLTFMFVLPLTGRWLAWLAAIFVFFGTDARLAVFAALPLALAWLYAANRLAFLPWSAGGRGRRPDRRREQRRFTEFKTKVDDRVKEREERERLRKLFEGSLSDDSDKKRG